MIERLEVKGVHTEVPEKLHKYISNKIGRLDRFIGKHARDSVRTEVILKEARSDDRKDCICEVVMHLPKEKITVQEATMNMYAAIDIVEAKLRNQLRKYKQTHDNPRIHQKLVSRLKRQPVMDPNI